MIFKALRREHSGLCDQSNNEEDQKTGAKLVLVPSPDEIDELSEIFTPLLDKIISNNQRPKDLESLRDTPPAQIDER